MAEKILIVDDDATMIKLLATILEIEGYQALEALSGDEALKVIAEEKPDLILLDIMMPELDGLEVLDMLRGDAATRHLPVVMLTARVEDEDIYEGWRRGADEYVTKPFEPKVLIETISKVLSRSVEERLEERKRNVSTLFQEMQGAEGGVTQPPA